MCRFITAFVSISFFMSFFQQILSAINTLPQYVLFAALCLAACRKIILHGP